MPKLNVTLLLLQIVLCTSVFSQTYPEPEFNNRPYSVSKENVLLDFERSEAKLEAKAKALGYGGSEINYVLPTASSSTRFQKNSLPKIIVKLDKGLDPNDLIRVQSSEVKKGKRFFNSQSYSYMSAKSKDISDQFVKLEFKKVQEGIYEVILPQDIVAGEYAFLPFQTSSTIASGMSSSMMFSTFGIDE